MTLAAKGWGMAFMQDTVTAQVKAPLAKEVDKRKLVEEAFLFSFVFKLC
jgi:hypothetical protein